MDDLSMRSERQGKVTVLTISGRVDSLTAPTLDEKLTELIRSDKKLVLHLKDVTFLSSAGVRTIINAVKAAKRARGEIKLAEIADHTMDILQTVGIMELVQAYPSVAEAIASF